MACHGLALTWKPIKIHESPWMAMKWHGLLGNRSYQCHINSQGLPWVTLCSPMAMPWRPMAGTPSLGMVRHGNCYENPWKGKMNTLFATSMARVMCVFFTFNWHFFALINIQHNSVGADSLSQRQTLWMGANYETEMCIANNAVRRLGHTRPSVLRNIHQAASPTTRRRVVRERQTQKWRGGKDEGRGRKTTSKEKDTSRFVPKLIN